MKSCFVRAVGLGFSDDGNDGDVSHDEDDDDDKDDDERVMIRRVIMFVFILRIISVIILVSHCR